MILDLYLVRHGQSYGNVPLNGVQPAHHVPLALRPPGVETGRMEDDWYLTPLGQKQAEALGLHLSGTKFDVIYASPLERAHATARAVAAKQSECIDVQTERGFLEIYDCGTNTPKEWHERGLHMARALRSDHPPGARVLVAAHGGFNNFLLHALLGLPGPAHLFRFRQNNTGLSRIVFYSEDVAGWERVTLCCINDLSHLQPELIS